ncbi:MAG: class I tRNA ligase family protein [Candidatus Moraniibacteriota bacterium]
MRKVDPKMNFPKLEAEVLEYWKRERIFEKSVERRDAAKTYSFYDGPPFATGLPHYGHLLQSILKDVVPRFKTMQGYRVPRVWGWDCHGLPIENLVEKELGFKNKKDIVAYGVERFDEACRSKVLEFTQDWKTYIERIGRFVDMEHPYKTMDADYMESVWWVFKELWDKGLIYEDYRIMHVCPHCETTLSQAEVSEGYEETKDLAATVKFELTEKPGTFLLAWTTTPWTLPGNVALAVNKDIEYAEVESEGVKYIAAAALLEQVFAGKEYTEARRFPGSELLGKAYRAPFDDYQKNTALENYENGWKVYHADFVTIDKGTGVAHEAPAFGADDWELLKQEHLPFVQHVSLDGTIKAEVPEFAGQAVKTVEDPQVFDVQIIKALAKKGLLFSKEQYLHDYPHCCAAIRRFLITRRARGL